MTPNEAYIIIKRQYPAHYTEVCLEYDKFYLFGMIPYKYIGATGYAGGSVFDAVDKKTGKITKYDILTDVKAYHDAKVHEIHDPILSMTVGDIHG